MCSGEQQPCWVSQPASDSAQTQPSFAAELSPSLLACLQGECGNRVVSILFYVTFTLAVPMIMIQLFAAVVIENFEKQQEMEEWSLSPALLEVGHGQRLRLLPSQACYGCHTQTGTLPASVQRSAAATSHAYN